MRDEVKKLKDKRGKIKGERPEGFTPGPWRFWRHVNEKYPEMSQTAIFGTGNKKFVMIAQTHDDCAAAPEQTVEEVIANAHLIAAAPEMYEMLKDCLEDMNDALIKREILDYLEESIENNIKKAEQVLKKARGEE